MSPEEREPQLPEEVVLVDAEEGTASELRDHAQPARGLSRDASSATLGEIEAYCRKYGWAYVHAHTELPFEDLMLKILREEGLLR